MTKIVYLKHKAIDKEKWDICVRESLNYHVFALSWYLNVSSPEWDALVYGNYEAVFPITQERRKAVFVFFNPTFVNQLGVFSKQEITPELVSDFLHTIPSKFKMIDIFFNPSCWYEGDKFVKEIKYSQRVDLFKSKEEIGSNYSKNLKRILKKAEKNVQIEFSSDVPSVIQIFKENRGKNIEYMNDEAFLNLEKTLQTIVAHNLYILCQARNEVGDLLAAAFFLKAGNSLVYIKGGSTLEGRKQGAMHRIMDFIIQQEASKNRFQFLDFGGSTVPEVRKFNLHFGSEDYTYQRIYKNNLMFRLFKKVAKLKEKM
jgi:hypothetical protein